jgi:hypothetical protein
MPKYSAETKLARIATLIAKIEQGQNVQARDIALVLSDSQLQAMELEWQEQKKLRKPAKPDEVIEYEKKLGAALLMAGRHEQLSDKRQLKGTALQKRIQKRKDMSSKAESLFEDALEYLQEVFIVDPTIQIWFDRVLDFDAGVDSDLYASAGGMPVVITSRSRDNQSSVKNTFGLKTKREVQLDALHQAQEQLTAELMTDEQKQEVAEKELEQQKALEAKLRALKGGLRGRAGK